MKQVLQSLKDGTTTVLDVPAPRVGRRSMLVQTRTSIISAGTERMLVEFGRANWIDKARQQPDKVKEVIRKVRTDGVAATMSAVRAKLDAPLPLGYCNAGIVVEVGSEVSSFTVGDRVVTNGPHAEFVSVPQTIAAKIPDGVSDDLAAMTPLAAIGLQGFRLSGATLGETVVVYGLGLIGLLTVQIARAAGCRVIGIDASQARGEVARRFGADVLIAEEGVDLVAGVVERTAGIGADVVLLTLATDSDEPIQNAAQMSRKRGRLVLVGVTGLHLRRDDFYKKELSFQVSCSYGPGRYDPVHEDQGIDYPLPYIRWTEARNFEAILGLMSSGLLTNEHLVSHRFPLSAAGDAYSVLTSGEPSLAIALSYERPLVSVPERLVELHSAKTRAVGQPSIACIGAGNFATRVLIPAFQKHGATRDVIVSAGGATAAVAASRFGFHAASSDTETAINRSAVDTVVIATRHDTHARLALQALGAGKHVFVEKPLALTHDDVDRIGDVARRGQSHLTIGFNRRFAPLTQTLAETLRKRSGPLAIEMTINAGAIPADHWTRRLNEGGGRIVGEACHFIDLARYLAGSSIEHLNVVTAGKHRPGADEVSIITLGFHDGSVATISYLSNGSKGFPKERITLFADGAVYEIDNFRRLRTWGGNVRPVGGGLTGSQDKGHDALVGAFLSAVRGQSASPIPLEELLEVSHVAIDAASLAAMGGGSRDYRT